MMGSNMRLRVLLVRAYATEIVLAAVLTWGLYALAGSAKVSALLGGHGDALLAIVGLFAAGTGGALVAAAFAPSGETASVLSRLGVIRHYRNAYVYSLLVSIAAAVLLFLRNGLELKEVAVDAATVGATCLTLVTGATAFTNLFCLQTNVQKAEELIRALEPARTPDSRISP